ncbi:MAG: hypothetical protein LC734_06200 [Acidobacteria bacterium]|nr:hypothetical protein [Acidobacteriota bacterium]
MFSLCIAVWTIFGQPTAEQRELAEFIGDDYDKREGYIPMRGGVKLLTAFTHLSENRSAVQIQSTWFPLVARNPQKYMSNYKLANNADFQKATRRIYFGGSTQSAIILPVPKR